MRVRHATLDELSRATGASQPPWLGAAVLGLHEMADPHSSRVLVAEEDGRVRGVLGLGFEWGRDGRLERAVVEVLVIDPEHDRRGIGSRLVRFAEGIVRIHGCTRVEVAPGLEDWGGGQCWGSLGYDGPDNQLSKELPQPGQSRDTGARRCRSGGP